MNYFPPLAAGSWQWLIPLAERSAAALEELWLAGRTMGAQRRLTECLAADPPLVMWAVCARAGSLDGALDGSLSSLSDVAQWLAVQGIAALAPAAAQAPAAPDDPPGAIPCATAERWAERVAQAVEAAELAAAGLDVAAADKARLEALLQAGRRWLWEDFTGGGQAALPPSPAPLPAWALAEPGPAPVFPGAAGAAGCGWPAQLDDARQKAAVAQRAWLAGDGAAGRRLRLLAGKLARLAQLEEEFAAALESAKLASMAELAAGAGHEINNPLAVIAGRAQLFLQSEHDPERRRDLALINTQAMRVHEMIADMMLFARPPAPQRQPVDINQVIAEVVEQLGGQAQQQNTRLEHVGPREPLAVSADPLQLTVALRALVVNALEALGHDGRIEIAAGLCQGQVQIRVSDDGPGIAAEVRPHLFDPFYSARQAGRGLGMGLAKCWRIVTNHGGRIDVESQPGRGATFVVSLEASW